MDRAAFKIDGLVLAGGKSRRFGSDKRQALWNGEPLVLHALRMLTPIVGGTLFVATGESREALPGTARAVVLRDEPSGRGPLGGIAAALTRSRNGILVLACDLPRVRRATLEELARCGLASGRPVAVRSMRGWEPLIAYYPPSTLSYVRVALQHGRAAPRVLLDRLAAMAVRPRCSTEIINVNRPSDLDRARNAAPMEETQ